MKLFELRTMMLSIVEQMKAQVQNLATVRKHLPEVPEGVDYVAVNSYSVPALATLDVALMTNSRADAVKVVDLFPPEPLALTYPGLPYFQPKSGVNVGTIRAYGATDIYPVTFNTSYYPITPEERAQNLTEFAARLTWFTRISDVRVFVSTTILDDPSRMNADGVAALPDGSIPVAEVEELGNGVRTQYAYWPIGIENWRERFVSQAEAEEDDWNVEEFSYEQ